MGVTLDILIWNWIPSGECKCPVSGLNNTVFTASDAGLWSLSTAHCTNSTVFTASDAGLGSPFTAHCTKKPNVCCGKSVIDSLLRAPWGPFAAPNANSTTVLHNSGTSSSCSAPSTICTSVVPSVLCALSYGKFAFEEKTFNGLSLRAGQRLPVKVAVIGLDLVCCVDCGLLP
jgi:hypothetical protein